MVPRLGVEFICVALYLIAIVAANAVVTAYGQAAMPFTAVVLIPFDLITRDVLHERWNGRRLWPKMILLIAIGSMLSAILSPAVAVASFTAFALAGASNAIVYSILPNVPRGVRMNASNLAAAMVDSVVFPSIAFAVIDFRLCFAQTVSKFCGGLVLTWVFLRYGNVHAHT